MIISLLKMLISNNFGAQIDKNFINNYISDKKFFQILFGEDAGNYLIVTNNEEKLKKLAKKNYVNIIKIGLTKRNYLNINNQIIKLAELKNNFENNFFNYINK